MKTARLTQIVVRCGQPTLYLALHDPSKDRALQTAVKEQRLMTVFQSTVGPRLIAEMWDSSRDPAVSI